MQRSDAPLVQKEVHLEQVYPVMLEVFDHGGQFSLTITGTSMYPTLLGNRDRVTLEKPPAQLAKYDLPLYRRENGQFVLHRIVRVEKDGTYTMCGDHQWVLEPGITQAQIVGLVVSMERKGKKLSATDPGYLRWVRFWVRMLPLRRTCFRAYSLAGRVKRMFRKKEK